MYYRRYYQLFVFYVRYRRISFVNVFDPRYRYIVLDCLSGRIKFHGILALSAAKVLLYFVDVQLRGRVSFQRGKLKRNGRLAIDIENRVRSPGVGGRGGQTLLRLHVRGFDEVTNEVRSVKETDGVSGVY